MGVGRVEFQQLKERVEYLVRLIGQATADNYYSPSPNSLRGRLNKLEIGQKKHEELLVKRCPKCEGKGEIPT